MLRWNTSRPEYSYLPFVVGRMVAGTGQDGTGRLIDAWSAHGMPGGLAEVRRHASLCRGQPTPRCRRKASGHDKKGQVNVEFPKVETHHHKKECARRLGARNVAAHYVTRDAAGHMSCLKHVEKEARSAGRANRGS